MVVAETSELNQGQRHATDQTALRFVGVGKDYAVSKGAMVQAVSDVSFDVPRGSFVSILGPSGCGKSTLLKMAAGTIEPTSGTVELVGAGSDIGRTNVGMVFQVPALLEWRTVMSNILLPIEILRKGRAEAEVRALELLKTAGLEGQGGRYPNELSGGMQQRVAICRALVSNPDVLLMDEPFAALDALTRDQMAEELLRIWAASESTIVLVTHSIDEAVLLSDQVVVMSRSPGRVRHIVDIDLPRPRSRETRYSPDFVEYVRVLRDEVMSL